MIIYTSDELQEAIELVTNAKNTDALPAHGWARCAQILLEERKQYYRRVEPKEGQPVQYLAVHVLDWPWYSGVRPTDAFVEAE